MKKLWILLILPFLIGASPTKVNDFVTQTTIKASEVNTNFDDLFGYLQTGVDTLRANAVDAITEITSSLKSGSDQTIVTGTKGTTEQMCVWNSDGDAVGLSTMTGDEVGVVFSAIMTNTSLTSCSSLSTNAGGQFICN